MASSSTSVLAKIISADYETRTDKLTTACGIATNSRNPEGERIERNYNNYAYSEYKHVLATILCSSYIARTPPVEARSPGRRSNVENVPLRRRPVTGQQLTQTPLSVCTMSSYRVMDASL